MDALIVTTDKEVLREGSVAEASMRAYATLGSHIVVFVLHTGAHLPPRRVASSLWIIPVSGPTLFFAALFAPRVAYRELFFQRRLQVGIVEACDPFEAGLAAALITRKFGTPLHLNVPSFDNRLSSKSPSNRLRRLLAAFLIPRADHLSTDSEARRGEMTKRYPAFANRISLVPRFVDRAAADAQELRVDLRIKYPAFKIILLAVCPLSAEYNPALAVSILAEVFAAYPHVGLVMVGDGAQKTWLKSVAIKKGVGDWVVFEPWSADIASYYKSAHIFLITGTRDIFGDTIAEAAGGSCAIVSTPIGIATEFIQDDQTGYLCNADDTACFVRTILRLIHHPEVRERIRLNGMLAAEEYLGGQGGPEARIAALKDAWERTVTHFQAQQLSSR